MPVMSAIWEAKPGGSLKARSLRPDWSTWQNPVCTKNIKICRAWWCMAVVPATQEAEAQESLKSWRRRLQWAEITPLYSSLGNRVRPCLKKTKKNFFMHKLKLLVTRLSSLLAQINEFWMCPSMKTNATHEWFWRLLPNSSPDPLLKMLTCSFRANGTN